MRIKLAALFVFAIVASSFFTLVHDLQRTTESVSFPRTHVLRLCLSRYTFYAVPKELTFIAALCAGFLSGHCAGDDDRLLHSCADGDFTA